MNQSNRIVVHQFGFFVFFALLVSTLCVGVSLFFRNERNIIMSTAVETVLSRSVSDPLTRSSSCIRVSAAPGIQYIIFKNSGDEVFFASWLTVNGLAGPEIPVFLIPENVQHYREIIYCGNLGMVDNPSADSGLTVSAIAGCKKRLFTLVTNGAIYDAK